MNQLSYKVSKKKLNSAGINLNGKISKDINHTIRILKNI